MMNSSAGATVHWHGSQQGQFQQTFTLSAAINSERVEASYADGTLTLNLPKAEHDEWISVHERKNSSSAA